MTPMIRFAIVILFLSFGVYANHVAKKQVKEIRTTEKRMSQLKRGLTENDYAFMHMVLAPANSGSDHGHNTASGSLIVMGGQVIGAGWDGPNFSADPTAHGTLKAVKDACNHLGTSSLKECVIYSGAQPCPMCLSLLYLMEVDKIIYLMDSDTKNLTINESLSQRVYRSLIKTPSERVIPEIVLSQGDLK